MVIGRNINKQWYFVLVKCVSIVLGRMIVEAGKYVILFYSYL
jgi:hypothetical protein